MYIQSSGHEIRRTLAFALALKSGSQIALEYLASLGDPIISSALLQNPALASELRFKIGDRLLTNLQFSSADAWDWLELGLVPRSLLKRVATLTDSYHSFELLADTELYSDEEVLEVLGTLTLRDDRGPLWQLLDRRPSITKRVALELLNAKNDFDLGFEAPHSSYPEALAGSRHLFDLETQELVLTKALKLRPGDNHREESPDWQTLFTLLANPNTHPTIKSKAFLTIEKSAGRKAFIGGHADHDVPRDAIYIQARAVGVLNPAVSQPWESLSGADLQPVFVASLLLSPERYPTLKGLFKEYELTKPMPSRYIYRGVAKRVLSQHLKDFKIAPELSTKSVTDVGDDDVYVTSFISLRADTIARNITSVLDPWGAQAYNIITELSLGFSGNLQELLDTAITLCK